MSDAQIDPTLLWALAAMALGVFGYMVYPAFDRRRWGMAFDTSQQGLMMSAISVLAMATLFSVMLLPALVLIIVVHEYGHVLAYRLAGHRAPVFQLAPFGGVAFSRERKKSHAESAYVSLMGPGFSVALLIPTMLAGNALLPGNPLAASYLLQAAWFIAWLNALNLLPFFPMDGGQALRAVARTISQRAAHVTTIGMALALAAYAALIQFWFLLIFAAIGLGAAVQANRGRDWAKPMTPGVALLAFLAHLAIFATHFFALYILSADLFVLF